MLVSTKTRSWDTIQTPPLFSSLAAALVLSAPVFYTLTCPSRRGRDEVRSGAALRIAVSGEQQQQQHPPGPGQAAPAVLAASDSGPLV